ncbi:cytochrome c [Oecophyllibacter saccharovorans]|uniref:cytochrome c n=1 Tax=Oecophyllibacter saccharovorans TaxID=2558360 RepID=UPI00116F058C|nr:c-type cytochrome [Oecophyllibacter saccharovorans]TPW36371.1 c-type cytochrome [Oecophyllibacter saccharovorans]
MTSPFPSEDGRFPRLRKLLLGLGALGFIGLGGFLILSTNSAIAPITPPKPDSFNPEAVRRGGLLAHAGYCAACHTRTDGKPGAPLAGDYAMASPFGTFYSSNITPDPETGIGRWSEAAFRRAMHRGISRDGHYLYAVFPYPNFTKMSDQDISDLYAWLMTQPAVRQVPRHDQLPFPLGWRRLQFGWRLLFFRAGEYQPDPHKDAVWNRGAYLANGVSHCDACHTPRNVLGGLMKSRLYDGAPIDNWIAPPLNASNPAPAPWTEPDLFAYLSTGFTPLHGASAGPMAIVVHEGYAHLPEADVHAVATYFADLDHAAQRVGPAQAKIEEAMKTSGEGMSGPFLADTVRWGLNPAGAQFLGTGMRLARVTCGACHANFGPRPAPGRPALALSTALWLPEPTNLYQIMLRGFSANEGRVGWVMPSYYTALTNQEMAEIAAYLRATRTNLPPWTDLEKKAAEVRAEVVPPPLPAPQPAKER